MDDLARFIVLRPPNLPDEDAVQVLAPPSIEFGLGRRQARQQALEVLRSEGAVRRVDGLQAGEVAVAVQQALGSYSVALSELDEFVTTIAGRDIEAVVADDSFDAEELAIADTLVASKLVSGWANTDAAGLASAAQGYDALRRAAAGEDPVVLRPLQMPTEHVRRDPQSDGGEDGEDSKDVDGRTDRDDEPIAPDTAPALRHAHEQARQLEASMRSLRGIRATAFAGAERTEPAAPLPTRQQDAPNEQTDADASEPRARTQSVQAAGTSWLLHPDAVASLPDGVRRTLEQAGLDPAATPLPLLMEQVEGLRLQHESTAQSLTTTSTGRQLARVGSSWLGLADDSAWVGDPGTAMPAGHGTVKSVGIGDLLLIKQHVLRYEGGELAHVENVLRSEHLSRETRRLDRTETTILTETEHTKEDERDTQTTDRFSLKRETSSVLKEETEFKAGVAVTAKYGPFVEVKANADFGTKSSSEETAKQATEFSKDVVSRAASKVIDRVLERRTTTTLTEFEEKYSHGFDNTSGPNISGVYQWVDKVLQAQVYNYGKRMLFDITVPEPATAFILTQSQPPTDGGAPVMPTPFTLTSDQVTAGNYAYWAHIYDVGGLEAPPPPFKTVAKALDGVFAEGDHESSKSAELVIDEGYQARYALFQRDMTFYDDHSWRVLIGNNWIDAFSTIGYVDMAAEVGSVAFAYDAKQVRSIAATVEIFCERTSRALNTWQLKTHAALTQGYLAKQQQYESKLAEAAARSGVVISGRNPLWNQRLVTTELRKQGLTVLTAQQFEAFGAMETSPQGYAQLNLARTMDQMPYVRFFEQAFEWEHLAYFFYPYFWGWKPAWKQRMLLDDIDPQFSDFLRAGAARLVIPVRPGFEAAVAHYLETGDIWNGGPAPSVNDDTYVPIVKEIQESQGAPGAEVPVGDPWLVRLPTTLVKLRPDDELPSWQKVGEDWEPVG